MELVKLQIKNFLSISDVELKPGKVNQIVGKNNQGKSSIVKALEAGLKGSTNGSLVKRGEDAAEIIIEFDNSLAVRRRIKNDGTNTVTVRKEGFAADKPQSFLNNLLSDGGFNPLDLLDPKARTANLLKAIDLKVTEEDVRARLGDKSPVPLPPVDYSQHGLKVVEQLHRYYYQRRAEANKDAEAKTSRFETLKNELPQAPTAPAGTREELQAQIAQRNAAIGEENKKKSLQGERQQQLERARARLQAQITTTEHLRSQIHQLQMKLEEEQNRVAFQQSEVANAAKAVAEVEVDQVKIDGLRNEVIDLQKGLTTFAELDAYQQRVAVVQSAEADKLKAEGAAEKLDVCVYLLGNDFKSELMKRTALPVAGLTYEDGQFLLDGDAIDNLSTSRALRLAVGIARKLAGPAKIICIDGAELLDAESYAALRSEIEGDGFTYFITKVGEAFEHPGDTVTVMNGGVASALQH